MTTTKTPCNITRSYFATEAKALVVEIKDAQGNVLARATIAPREFSTGSLGWNVSQALHLDITPSTTVKCQLGLNLTIANSKELPKA
jgi:hypothetical protein